MSLAVFAGLATLDVVHRVERLAGPDEKVTALAQEVCSGGPAANAAKTYAALGGDARLLTCLGCGPVAGLVRADLERAGVEVVDATPDRVVDPPVASVSILPDGSRSVTGSPTAPFPDAVPPSLESLLEGADCVLVDGHHAPLALAVARAASARGLELVVDAGRPKPVFDALWPLAGTAICAEGYALEPGAPASRTAEALMALGVRRVALTAGSGPIRWWVSDPRGDEPGSGEIRPRPVRAVDTLGAGDVLHGAYCAVRNRRRASFADHLRAAADLATERTRHEGLGDWLAALARDTRRRVRWS